MFDIYLPCQAIRLARRLHLTDYVAPLKTHPHQYSSISFLLYVNIR